VDVKAKPAKQLVATIAEDKTIRKVA